MPLLSLPSEIILLIAYQLDSNGDFSRLLLVNHFLHNLLNGQLYRRDISDTGGLALLFYANWGYDSAAQHMLAAGVNADIRGPLWGTRTPLLLAISRHHTTLVKILLDHGACPNFMDNVKHGPLETAILNECGDDMIELLLDYGADVNLKGYQERTPLFTAVSSGNSRGVALLLARGANVHARETKDGRIPLHFAAEKAGSSDVVKMLLDAGSDVNCLSGGGITPLCMAVGGRDTDVIQTLLDRGSDVHLRTPAGDDGGQTALHYACKCWGGTNEVIRLLIDHGADVNSRDFRQRTPLFLVGERSRESAEVLLNHGADICARDERGCTVLHYSAKQMSVKMVTWLCERGANVKWSNDNGETPLFMAIGSPVVWKKTPKIIQALLDLGADANHENRQGQSPLCLAASSGCPVTTKMLLVHGANVHNTDRQGMTAIHWSTRTRMAGSPGHVICEIIGLLIEHGADVNSRNLAGQTPLGMNLQSGTRDEGTLQVRECLINAGGTE